MITLFESKTYELPYNEKRIARSMAEGLSRRVGKSRAITSKELIEAYNTIGVELTGARVRKIVNYIRMTGMVERLMATSKGYYVSNDDDELNTYIESLLQRSDSIRQVAEQLNFQREKLVNTKN